MFKVLFDQGGAIGSNQALNGIDRDGIRHGVPHTNKGLVTKLPHTSVGYNTFVVKIEREVVEKSGLQFRREANVLNRLGPETGCCKVVG